MLDKILLELLKANNRVIVPKVGAFILKKQGDQTSITFNSILKFDDGLLASHFAKTENLDKTAANVKVKNISDEILKTINDGNQYKISGVGSLYKDANGKLQFIEGDGKAPATGKTKTAEKKEEPKKTESKTSTSGASASATKKTPDSSTSKATSTKQETTASAGAAQKSGTTTSSSSTAGKQSTTSQSSKPSTTKTSGSEPSAKSTSSGTTTKAPKKKSQAWLYISIIVLFIAIGATVYLMFIDDSFIKEKKYANLFKKEDALVEKVEEEHTSESASEERKDTEGASMDDTEADDEHEGESEKEERDKDKSSETTEEQKVAENKAKKQEAASEEAEAKDLTADKAPKQAPAESSATNGKQFYVVAGCFEEERNANSYVRKLKKEGYNQAQKFGMHRNMHAVCYSAYGSMSEAIENLKQIRASTQPNAWLLKY